MDIRTLSYIQFDNSFVQTKDFFLSFLFIALIVAKNASNLMKPHLFTFCFLCFSFPCQDNMIHGVNSATKLDASCQFLLVTIFVELISVFTHFSSLFLARIEYHVLA